jgi:hypothetical protein
MKARRPDHHRNFESRRREKVVATWRALGERKVGEEELRGIQQALGDYADNSVSSGGAISPAAIARILADEGAELRHPEIIEFNASWLEAEIQREAGKLDGLREILSEAPVGLQDAESLIGRLEKMRMRFDRAGDKQSEMQVRTLAIEARDAAVSRSKNKVADEAVRAEQAEVASWLAIWLQNPELFDQWLELRKSSPDFKQKFR